MKKLMTMVLGAGVAVVAFAQVNDGFLNQQAYAEMQRVAGQVDIVEQNLDELAGRVTKVEAMRGEIDDLKRNVAALQAQLAELKSIVSRQRGEIVSELSEVIRKSAAPAPVSSPASSYTGGTEIYTVRSGDTLSLISEAFGSKVSVIKELNGLRNDNIRVGQKLRVPAK